MPRLIVLRLLLLLIVSVMVGRLYQCRSSIAMQRVTAAMSRGARRATGRLLPDAARS
ncbi:hypothetical protein HC891_11935, partial [Candidatus Gracilibacteria bacterium]|nr:hypothetical protein [Candidatus Gracilibacteria bacterium]